MNGMPPDNVEQEIQAVKEDLNHLRGDIQALIRATGSEKEKKMRELKDRLCDAGEYLKKRLDRVGKMAAKTCDQARRNMSESPVRSVLIALAAGAVIGRLIGSRR